MNRLKALQKYGQSIWLDYIQRELIANGRLKEMIEEDALAGVTSNPSIFEKAINGSDDYTDSIKSLKKKGMKPVQIYEELVIQDIKDAADILRPVYEMSGGRDGYVSLEVSPHLAYETEETIKEARRLWNTVGRKNLMIKVPGTQEGIPAVERLLGEGINVNVTLLFAIERYEDAAMAYIRGLEKFAEKGGDLSGIASVASFFVSRIDTAVDAIVKECLNASNGGGQALKEIMGKVAIANAKLAYRRYRDILMSDRWQLLKDKGARPQRVLWASTSTKNPVYSDVLYVEELIGKDTVNTIPPATLKAFREHGRVRPSLEEDVDKACRVMEMLEEAGISMKEVTEGLLEKGVQLFSESFDKLLDAVEKRCR